MGVIRPQQKTWARTPEGDCLAPGGMFSPIPPRNWPVSPCPGGQNACTPAHSLEESLLPRMKLRGRAQHPAAQIWPPSISGSLQNPTTDNRCHSVSSGPHIRHLGVPSEPYTRYLRILLEPHTKCIRISSEPYTRHIRVLSEPHTTHLRTPSESHTRHLRVSLDLHNKYLRVPSHTIYWASQGPLNLHYTSQGSFRTSHRILQGPLRTPH